MKLSPSLTSDAGPITVLIRLFMKILTMQITFVILIFLSVSLIPIRLNHFIFAHLIKENYRSV